MNQYRQNSNGRLRSICTTERVLDYALAIFIGVAIAAGLVWGLS